MNEFENGPKGDGDNYPAGGGMQFDRVEPPPAVALENQESSLPDGTLSCGGCQSEIDGVYYEINGGITCESCHGLLLQARESGSGMGRFARATAFGLLAGAVGCGIYYGILKLTGYEVGLIAILVGFMVGAAVKVGSNHRGGWAYQTLAVVITYISIVGSYVPMLVEELSTMEPEGEISTTAEDEAGLESPALVIQAGPEATEEIAGPSAEEGRPPAPTEPDSVPQPGPAAQETHPEQSSDLGAVEMLIGGLALVILVLALPFLAGLENFLGLLIIGFGLWQAGSMNRREPFSAAGPFRVGERADERIVTSESL